MKVLCAYRDPESGATMLRSVRELVRDGDEVIVAHIVDFPDLPWEAPEDEFVDRAEADMAAREERIRETATDAGLVVSLLVDVANPGEGTGARLAREAGERGADLVVVVSKRASGVRGLLLGSVAQGLLELAPCPVLVVRPPEPDATSRSPGRDRPATGG